MFDINITVDNEKKLQELSALISRTINVLDGVDSCEEVDSDVGESSDED